MSKPDDVAQEIELTPNHGIAPESTASHVELNDNDASSEVLLDITGIGGTDRVGLKLAEDGHVSSQGRFFGFTVLSHKKDEREKRS